MPGGRDLCRVCHVLAILSVKGHMLNLVRLAELSRDVHRGSVRPIRSTAQVFLVSAVSTFVACAADDEAPSAGDARGDASMAQSDAGVDAMPPGVDCSLPPELGTTFSMVDASGNGLADNPLDIEVVASMSDTITFFFNSYNAKPVPLGKQEMAGQWLDGNCEFCLFINSVDSVSQEQHLWFPLAGEIDVVSVKENFIMSGTDLVFQHVRFVGDTLAVEPAPDRCTVLIPTLRIDTPMRIGNQ